jgi:hypothetical protein
MDNSMAGLNSEIPACLAEWIERNMPEIGGLKGVRVRCCDRLPFQWLPGFMPDVRGITLWNTIYLKERWCPILAEDPDLVGLLVHELVHVGQFRRAPLLFPLRYLWDLARVGYWKIPAEQEARERETEFLRQYLHDQPCGH